MHRKRKILSLTFMLFLLILGASTQKTSVANNGNYTVFSTATIYVDPRASNGTIGQNFTININVANVTDLYGWEFKLGWNVTVLDAVNVTEGSFLRSGGSTYFYPQINNTAGYVLVDCTLLGTIPGVSGNGILATVRFYVKTAGECILDLYNTILVNSTEMPIMHTAIGGYYYTLVHDVAVVNLVASESVVNVTVKNQGTCAERFDVSTYYTHLTEPLIGTQTVTLNPGASAALTFNWTPPTYGWYEILASASIVPGEIDTANNNRTTIIYVSGGSRW